MHYNNIGPIKAHRKGLKMKNKFSKSLKPSNWKNADWNNVIQAYNSHRDTDIKVQFDQDLTEGLKSFNDAIMCYRDKGLTIVSLNLKGAPEAGAKLFHFIQKYYVFEDDWNFYIERFAGINKDNSFPFTLGLEKTKGVKGSTSLQELNCHELGNLDPLSNTYNFVISDRAWVDPDELNDENYHQGEYA
jgi:hypothetical protein